MGARRTVDIDFACWYCERDFERPAVEGDAQLVPRARHEGGPYLLYDCPACTRPSRVERNRAGAFLAGPIPIVPVVDALFASFDRDRQAELERKREHGQRRDGRRDWFFEAYARELWAEGVRPHNVSATARERAASRRARREAREREAAERRRRRARARAERAKPSDSPPPEPPPRDPPPREPPRPQPPAPELTPLEVLGLDPDPSREEVTAAFRDLAKRYHPDRFDALDDEFKALAHRKFLQLKAARDALLGEG